MSILCNRTAGPGLTKSISVVRNEVLLRTVGIKLIISHLSMWEDNLKMKLRAPIKQIDAAAALMNEQCKVMHLVVSENKEYSYLKQSIGREEQKLLKKKCNSSKKTLERQARKYGKAEEGRYRYGTSQCNGIYFPLYQEEGDYWKYLYTLYLHMFE